MKKKILGVDPIFFLKNGEEKGKNKEMLPMFVIYLQQHVHIQKEKKKKGILKKLIAQPNPKFNLSKCVASWTQSNLHNYKGLFPLGCCDFKVYPNKKLSITFVSSSSQWMILDNIHKNLQIR